MIAGASTIGAWPIVVGIPAAVVLWMRTSYAHTDRSTDRLMVGAVALSCIAAVVTRPIGQAVVALPLAVVGSAAACVDAREGRLPDALTLPLLPATLIAVGVVAARDGLSPGATVGAALAEALLAAASGLLVVLIVKLVASSVVGWGDVKLAPSLAIVVGDGGSALGFTAVVAVGVALTALLIGCGTARRGATSGMKEDVVPYGPALVLGALFAAGPG